MSIIINPVGGMDLLSQMEIEALEIAGNGENYRLFRDCALAVLNSGNRHDTILDVYNKHEDFDINVVRRERGVKLELSNPPESAFVDGAIIRGLQEHLFATLRDILYLSSQLENDTQLDLQDPAHITHVVFSILKHAHVFRTGLDPKIVVCWGGHSISDLEYNYTHEVGHQLGLRELDVCTGCGPGAMEGPMRGATVGHAKQRASAGRYIGLTEPSIIAAEPPNQIVNELVILPDIEKRLEAFVRLGHGVVIFPGGVGTAEEFLYMLGLKLHPSNKDQPLPIVLTGPKQSEDYFQVLKEFVTKAFGKGIEKHFQIIIDDPENVAKYMKDGIQAVRAHRKELGDAYSFNWSLKVPYELQMPFEPTHENMAALDLSSNQPLESLAANLRRAFSGIVSGNVKKSGIEAIEKYGPFQLHVDQKLMTAIDELLQAFIDQQRMKLPGTKYVPCYQIVK